MMMTMSSALQKMPLPAIATQRLAYFWLALLLTVANQRVSATAATCSAGQYYSTAAAQCRNCSNGTFCGVGQQCVDACIACPIHTQSDANHTTCLSGTCMVCPAGSYCIGTNVIVGCPSGTYSSTVGLNLLSGCISCAAGTFATASGLTVCVKCASGLYASGLGSTVCTVCVQATYSTGTSQTSMQNCVSCPNGTYATGSALNTSAACLKCAPGTYGSAAAASTCLLCQPGTYSSAFGLALVAGFLCMQLSNHSTKLMCAWAMLQEEEEEAIVFS